MFCWQLQLHFAIGEPQMAHFIATGFRDKDLAPKNQLTFFSEDLIKVGGVYFVKISERKSDRIKKHLPPRGSALRTSSFGFSQEEVPELEEELEFFHLLSSDFDPASHPCPTALGEPAANREPTDKPPTTHQPQTDWWHEGPVFKTLPYCVQVVGNRMEILDRRYRLIVALFLKRKPTDRQLAAISWNGEVVEACLVRKVWLYADSCRPELEWKTYAVRLEKLGHWPGGRPE